MTKPISVTTLNNQIKSILENTFSRVLVEGELSRITYHNSGHIYFSLKDENSTIKAVMFRGNATKLKFRLEEGLKVIIDASISVYTPRGDYQLNCFSIEPAGQGALAFAYEQLKEKLKQKGYFDPNIKKPLPKFPKKIALVTSATSAALQDMLRISNARYPLTEIYVYDTIVQGEDAKYSIVENIKKADAKGYDVIVVARGGGSLEDLWCFNEEIVADAIYEAKTPVISAIGHEIDYLISDFVADKRASTPSNAMEILLPDKNEILIYLDTLREQFDNIIDKKLFNTTQLLNHLYELFYQNSIEKKIENQLEIIQTIKSNFKERLDFIFEKKAQYIQNIKTSLDETVTLNLNRFENTLTAVKNQLESNNPKYKTKKGFAQIVVDGDIKELNELELDQTFLLQDIKTTIKAKVLKKGDI